MQINHSDRMVAREILRGDEDRAALIIQKVREQATAKALSARPAGDYVLVREIETVTGDFCTEPGEPFYRIEIDGFCADFDYREAADNFAAAINARIATLEAQLAEAGENIRQNLVELERINHTKATDFNMVRQLIVDNRATLSKIGGGDGNG